MLAAERLTPFCRRGAAALTLEGGPADMVRLVRTLRVRRGAMPGRGRLGLKQHGPACCALSVRCACGAADHVGKLER